MIAIQNFPVRSALDNGTKLLVKESHATPLVAVCVLSVGGVRYEAEGHSGISHMVQRTLLKGTVQHTGAELATIMEYMGLSFSPFTAKDFVGCSMQVLSRHLDRALELMAEILWQPVFPLDAVEREKRNIASEIEKKQDDTVNYAMEMCDGALFPHHPYRFPLVGTTESVAALDRDALVYWHPLLYHRPAQLVVSVVGDVQAEAVFERVTGMIPSGPVPQSPPEPVLSPAIRKSVELIRPKRQAAISLGFQAPSLRHPDLAAFDVLNSMLAGMGSRLFIELRDKQGLAYVVSSHYDPRLDAGSFRCYMATRPDQREVAVEALRHELARLRQEPASADEVQRSIQYLQGMHEIALQRNGAQASRYAWYEATGLGYERVEQYPADIALVTPADVQRCARQYLTDERSVLAEVIPEP